MRQIKVFLTFSEFFSIFRSLSTIIKQSFIPNFTTKEMDGLSTYKGQTIHTKEIFLDMEINFTSQ